jgi:hypothetical protein
VLLLAAQPMSIDDVMAGLADRGFRPPSRQQRTPRKIVADVLRYQCTLNRVRRSERAVYEAVRGQISRSMRDRCIRSLKPVRGVGGLPGGGAVWAWDG